MNLFGIRSSCIVTKPKVMRLKSTQYNDNDEDVFTRDEYADLWPTQQMTHNG